MALSQPTADPRLEIFPKRGILAIDVTALLTAGQKNLVGIPDQRIRKGFVFARTDAGGLVVFGDLAGVGDDGSVLITKVPADDDPHVIEFEALHGVDASDHVLLFGVDREEGAFVWVVPAGLEASIIQKDVDGAAVVFDVPVITIARDETGFASDPTFLLNRLLQGAGVVIDPEIEILAVEIRMGCLLDSKEIIQKGKVTLASVAAEWNPP